MAKMRSQYIINKNRISFSYSMSVDSKALKSLEDRINYLHSHVFSIQSNDLNTKPLDVLEKSQCMLKEVEKRHVVITQLWKKLPQLDEYLNTDFMQKIHLTEEVKTSLILANEDNLKQLSTYLEELKCLQNVVNHHSLKDISKHSSTLEPTIQLHLDQMEETHVLSDRVEKLLTAYNKIISTLSKQFMLWNNFVTQCELALDMDRDVIE